MAAALQPHPVSTRQFHWDGATRQYVGEISSTHGLGRVYADACDEGLTLVCAATGNAVVFVVDEVNRDTEGDILWWHLVPTNDVVQATVLLFND